MTFSDYINPTRLVDTSIFPNHSNFIIKQFKNCASLIAMTPLGRFGHITIAVVSVHEAYARRAISRTCVLTAYIAGMVFYPVVTGIAAQCVTLYKNSNHLFSAQHSLNSLAIISSVATIFSNNPHLRVTAVALRMINFLNEARIEHPKSTEKCVINSIGAAFCAADLYQHSDDVINTAEAIKNIISTFAPTNNNSSNNFDD